MSEEQTNVAQETATENQTQETNTEVKVETPKQNTFTQEQLDNIIKTRLEAEKSKYEKKLQEEEKQKAELLKEQQLKEAKSKSEIEKIMQDRIKEKEDEVLRYKTQIKKEKVDNSILSIASKNNAINPSQVVALLKEEVKYTDDGRIEVVDNHSNVRYNAKGELFTLEDRVNEFLDSNPHFRKGSLSGSGSQSAVGGKTVKPLNIQDLDLTKPEDRKAYAEYRAKRDSGAVEINLNNK
ncbi:Phage minor structural protein GP20 [uncultured Mediterranean phage uvMED]|nr:Phage minor structural protein GP20 [uncultured Mediterranean phage uvMED]